MISFINSIAYQQPFILFIFLGIIALLIGSFLNVIIYRLPLMMEYGNSPQKQSINLCFPRSHCPGCKQMIPAWHNIPLLSYLLLRGRCHACRQPISWYYPTVELLCLTLSLVAAYLIGFNLTLVFALPFIWILICLSFIDLQHQLLPDTLTLGLLWLGLIANTQFLFASLPNAVLSAVGAYLILWVFIKLFYLCTGKIGMGHGDFKLFAALGAWFGWQALLPIILSSSILGTIIGLIYLGISRKTKETPIPFGPFLCISGCGYLFFTMLK
ncbi:MAG: prepilin peptidase [Legionellaceae bacterium]|nr:prepilin peptidase [Legionellaceae bacterium]